MRGEKRGIVGTSNVSRRRKEMPPCRRQKKGMQRRNQTRLRKRMVSKKAIIFECTANRAFGVKVQI
jgi:hypothetical protein